MDIVNTVWQCCEFSVDAIYKCCDIRAVVSVEFGGCQRCSEVEWRHIVRPHRVKIS